MKKKSIFLFFLMFASFAGALHADCSSIKNSQFLTNRLKTTDSRYASFLLVLELLQHRNVQTLVETGTARDGDKNFFGDGGSTIIFGDWASKHNAKLSTVDIDPVAIANSKEATEMYEGYIDFFCHDSISFLKDFDRPIDFLYLDSFDFNFRDPQPSQEHHLAEIIAAYPKLHEKSIVMLDDCDLPYGGKGKLVIEYLLSRGWIIIYNGYQVILAQ